MKNLDDAKIKQSILNFLDKLKENNGDLEETEKGEIEIPVIEETVNPLQPQPVTQQIQPKTDDKRDISDYIFDEYIGAGKKNKSTSNVTTVNSSTPQKSQVVQHQEPLKEKKIQKKQERIVEKKETIAESNLILDSLKENTSKLETLTEQVEMASNCKFKFDIRRDNNGFISSVVVEKIKE